RGWRVMRPTMAMAGVGTAGTPGSPESRGVGTCRRSPISPRREQPDSALCRTRWQAVGEWRVDAAGLVVADSAAAGALVADSTAAVEAGADSAFQPTRPLRRGGWGWASRAASSQIGRGILDTGIMARGLTDLIAAIKGQLYRPLPAEFSFSLRTREQNGCLSPCTG